MHAGYFDKCERYGRLWIFRLFCYPLTCWFTTAFRLFSVTSQTFRSFANNPQLFTHFTPRTGIGYLFYWTEEFNLIKYGRRGKSPLLGLGNFPLSQWFHLTKPSLWLYRIFGAFSILAGMLVWWSGHLVWLSSKDGAFVLFALILVLLSPLFYLVTFGRQNYNVVGWAFFPLGFYLLISNHWLLASLVWLLCSFGSFTLVVILVPLTLVMSAQQTSFLPLLTLIPAALKISTHFLALLTSNDLKSGVGGIARIIGLDKRKARYQRSYMHGWSRSFLMYLGLTTQFLLVIWYLSNQFNLLMFFSIFLYFVNYKFARFADEQSLHMLLMSVGFVSLMQCGDWPALLSFALMLAPLPLFAGFPVKNIPIDMVPQLKPFYIGSILSDTERFIDKVPEGAKILTAFDNPQKMYSNLFDGYSALIEPASYVCSRKGIHFMPDWWMVTEMNCEDVTEYWGRDVDSVMANSRQLNADYVIIYQTENKNSLDSQWCKAGFKLISKFDWNNYKSDFGNNPPFTKPVPCWWLLKVPMMS